VEIRSRRVSCAGKDFPGTATKDNRDDLSEWRFSIRGGNKTIISLERKNDLGS
jgi:hypothetical protein